MLKFCPRLQLPTTVQLRAVVDNVGGGSADTDADVCATGVGADADADDSAENAIASGATIDENAEGDGEEEEEGPRGRNGCIMSRRAAALKKSRATGKASDMARDRVVVVGNDDRGTDPKVNKDGGAANSASKWDGCELGEK